jgi:uncharacterized protein (TIGR02466 family)
VITKYKDLEILPLFPSLLIIKKNLLTEEENTKLVELCYNLKKEYPSRKDGWMSKEKSPNNTYDQHNIAEDQRFIFFTSKVNDSLSNSLEFMEDGSKIHCLTAWANIYQEGNFQESHSHSLPSIYSCVFFPKVPQNSGAIVFESPFYFPNFDAHIIKRNIYNSEIFYHEPIENSLIIFRSNLRHFVLPGKNIDDRISIALNYTVYL